MPIEYQTFAEFRDVIQPLVAPEDLGEEMEGYFRDQIGNALADIQTLIPWYREMNVDFYTKEQVNEFCAASVFDGPVGKVTHLFAYKPGADCKKFYYQRQSTAAIDCWMETQRCVQCGPTTPPSESIYESPYCNYVVGGETACNPPYLTAEEDDCRFKSLDDDSRIYAVGPDYKVFAAPRFPCTYILCLQWQGIRRKWDNTHLVPVDQQLREAVVNYVEAKMATKERNSASARDYFDLYTNNLKMLKYRYDDEQRTDPKRDCSAGIEQLMSAFNPLYATPVYGPAYAPSATPEVCPACPECPECPECPDVDTALEQAVYVPSEDAIFGVRGQWVFKFNADTGAVEDEFRFVDDVIGDSSISFIGSFLYVATWRGVAWNFVDSPNRSGIEIYKIPFDFSSSTPLGIVSPSSIDASKDLRRGFTALVNDGTNLYGVQRGNVFKVNPAAPGGYAEQSLVGQNAPLYDIHYDSVNGVLWTTDWDSDSVDVYANDVWSSFNSASSIGSVRQIFGVTFSSVNTKIYCVRGDRNIVKGNADTALATQPAFLSNFAVSTLSNILSVGAKPIRLKFNPADNLIYIPTWSGDSVEVFNPATDTITTVKTGFNSPIDVIFTPTKKWAVQNSVKALKEIV